MSKNIDLLKHFFAFAVLAGCAAAGVAVLRWPDWLQAPVAILAAIAVGMAWEAYQRKTGKGTPDWTDVMADAAGAFVVATGLNWGTAAAAWWLALAFVSFFGALLIRSTRETWADMNASQAETSGGGGPGPIQPPPK